MSKKSDQSIPEEKENPNEIKEPKDGDIPSDLNSPEVDEEGKPTQKAITSFKQAHSIAKRLYDKAKDGRIKTAAAIAKKYGGEQPYSGKRLEATGQGWRNNFTTHFLASIVDRAKPQLVDPIKSAKYLTYSSLPPGRDFADEKSDKFRARITKLIRSWPEWVNFIDIVAQEDYLFGNTAPGYIDDDWRPKAWRFDESFLPEGTGQHANQIPYICYRQPILLHDFLQKLRDTTAMEDAGFDKEGCRKAANGAAGLRADGDESEMQKVDKWRENGSVGYTYAGDDIKVIWLFHVLVREYDGKVALWTVEHKEGHPIRHVEDVGDKMEDICALFTLQTGNEKFYGSKGAGRMLANLHTAIERLRNLGSDQVYLSGLVILQANEVEINSINPTVRHPFIVVPKGCEVSKEQINFDPQAFEFMDNKLVAIAESIAGAFIPPNVDKAGSASTRIDAAQKAARELAVRNGVLGRFFQQFGELIGAMQRRICKPDNLKEALRIYDEQEAKKKKGIRVLATKAYEWLKQVLGGKKREGMMPPDKIEAMSVTSVADEEAVACLVDLLSDGLTPQDIIELALSPAGNDVQDENPEEENKLLGYIASKKQVPDPFVNQQELSKMEAEAVLGEEGAKRVIIEDKEDPNVEAIASRQQIIEFSEMLDGNEMPAAITDNHKIHRKVLLTKIAPIMHVLETAPTPELLVAAKLGVNHYVQHLSMDARATKDQTEKELEGLKGFESVIQGAESALEKLAAQAAQTGGGPNDLPPPVNGRPAGPAGESQQDTAFENEKLKTEVVLRAADQAIQHRKLDIEERKLDLDDQHRTMDAVTRTGLDVARETARAAQEGTKDAEKDLKQEAGVTSEPPVA